MFNYQARKLIIQWILAMSRCYLNTLLFGIIVWMKRIEKVIMKYQRSSSQLPFKQIRVVADLPKLHDQIHEVLDLLLALLRLKERLQGYLRPYLLIESLLSVGQFANNFMLKLLTELLFDVLLNPSEHEGLEYCMESVELVLLDLPWVSRVCLDILREPLLELVVVIKQLGHNKVQQSPELRHCVLDRGSS